MKADRLQSPRLRCCASLWAALLCALIFSAESATLVPTNTVWKYFIGTNEPTPLDLAQWRMVEFDDSSWASGAAPIGYANPPNDSGGFEARIATTLPASSSTPSYTSVYLRKAFIVNDPSLLSEVMVTLTYDDGVIAWINGVPVGRNRVPEGELPFTAVSTSQADAVTTTFPIANPGSVLRSGTNILAIHLLNGSKASLDLLMEGSIHSRVDDIAPVIVNRLPTVGTTRLSLTEVEVFFSEPVRNVDAADLLVNGVAATNVLDVNGSQFLFQFASPAPGLVQIAFGANHGIADLAAVPNEFGGAAWTYTLDPNAPVTGIVISEFLADNEDGIHDEDGDKSDWIELFNGNRVAINLEGWYLTDTPLNLKKWRFPAVGIAEAEYLTVFASSKNRTNATSPLHTNFRLSNNAGSYLALVDPTGTNVVSHFASYPAQLADVSYGRDRNDADIVGYYTSPTPGEPNSVAGNGFSGEVQFSKMSSTFVNPFLLTLTASDSNTVIHYYLVTNAISAAATNVPNLSSPIYSAPISVSGPVIVRARAYSTQAGILPGRIHSETFLRLDANVLNFSSDLPLLIIHNFGAGPYPTSQADLLSAFAVFDTSSGRAALTNTPVLTARAGVNLRGYSTLTYPKSSFSVEFKNEFNDEENLSVLEMPPESDWVLYAPNNIEPVLFHNPLYYQMSREIGRYAPRTRFAEVFVNTSGGSVGTNHYNGVYVVAEKPKRAADRIDIAGLDVEDTNAPAISGGYVFTSDWVDANDVTYNVPGAGVVPPQVIIYNYPRGPTIRLPQRDPQEQYINHYLRSFVTNLASAGFNSSTGYVQYINVDSWIDYLVTAVSAMNTDALRWSTYFHKDRNAKIDMGPVWDCDRCMGSTDGRNFTPRTWAGGGTDYFNWSWWGRLFADPNFFQRFVDRYQEVRKVAYSDTNLFAVIDGFAAELQEAYPREFARWRVPPRGTNGTGTGTFATEVQWKKNWFAARLHFMDTNFLAPVALSHSGGPIVPGTTVTLTPPNRTGAMTSGTTNSWVYYTLDGSDPRVPGGGVLAGARSNLGPLTITVTNNVRIFARAFNPAHRNLTGFNNPPVSTSWSGPTEVTFFTSIPPLRITEIMYHPQNPAANSLYDQDDFEYIEVRNTGDTPLNVHRFRLRGGVEFDFPNQVLVPGEAALVVKNVDAFSARYGPSPRILGMYSKNLANDGDRLVLEGGVREPILDFRYSDAWYPITDGVGFSLQIIDDEAAPETWGLKQSWRPAGRENGTPGNDDPGAPTIVPVVVNEALTHTEPPTLDAIELHNPAGSSADISHWWLSDDFDAPRKFRIAVGTMIQPGGYIVFTEAQFNAGANAFALSSEGDEIYLFSGDTNGNLTGYAHGFDFGGQFNGITFGRHVISTGEDHLVRQVNSTLAAENSGVRVGPVVISEVNYHPVGTQVGLRMVENRQDEYVELHNISATNVALYDTAHPTNTWRVRDAVEFQFPVGVTIAPQEFVLLVGFDPANSSELSAFKSRNNTAAGVRVFGPWTGQLDNGEASVELAEPNLPVPGAATGVSYVLVDKVKYSDAGLWPAAADGNGASIHRRITHSYGNDPANWTAALRSPGVIYRDGDGPTIVQHPEGLTTMAYTQAMFRVTATGTGPISYQWRFNGTPIVGATSSNLVLSSALPSQAGTYDVVVFNASGAVASEPAILRLRIPLEFTAQPQSRTVQAGTNVSFQVSVAGGEPPVRFQWLHNGSQIAGATDPVYVIEHVELAHEGTYTVVASDALSTATSGAAQLRVVVPPLIVIQPVMFQATPMGGTASFSVTITNTATLPISYRWRRAGITVPGAFYILNDHTSILTLPNVTNLNPLTYQVLVTNLATRNGILSLTATNVAIPDNDQDGIPDSAETEMGLSPDNPTDAFEDPDSDNMTTLEEYIAGTDPRNGQNYLKVDHIIVPGAVFVEFSAVSNRTYTVQFADNLAAGHWENLGSVSARATNHTASLLDPNANPARYYRLVTPGHQ